MCLFCKSGDSNIIKLLSLLLKSALPKLLEAENLSTERLLGSFKYLLAVFLERNNYLGVPWLALSKLSGPLLESCYRLNLKMPLSLLSLLASINPIEL